MDVLYQFNEKYAPYAGTSITSLFENNKNIKIEVHILGEGLSKDSVDKFNILANKYNQKITFYETEGVIKLIKELNIPAYRDSYAANLRMFASSFLSDNIDRLLYLDSDTIVVGDISNLFSTNLEGNIVGMIIDSLGNSFMKEILGIDNNESYFNSGVILYDLKKWREENITDNIIDFVNNNDTSFSSPDQDILNSVLNGRIEKLSPRYNFQPFHMVYPYELFYKYYGSDDYYSANELKEAEEHVSIFHSFRFVGEFPWDKNSIHPYRNIFDNYLKMSLWSDYIKTDPESSFMMKVEKILYIILPKKIFIWFFSKAHHMYIKKKAEIVKL